VETKAQPDRALVVALARQIVAQVAPEEDDLFDEMVNDYFANPSPPELAGSHTDEPLAFGLSDLLVAVTPAAAAVASTAIAFIAGDSSEAVPQADAGQTLEQIKQVLQDKQAADAEALTLSHEQLDELRQLMRATAARYGMDPAQSDEMANAVLVSLMLGEDAAEQAVPPLKVLFLAANPQEYMPLRLDRELRTIKEVLLKGTFRNRVYLEQEWAVRVSDLQGLLLRFSPDIVHFSGHGQMGIVLVNDRDEAFEVPAAALAEMFGHFADSIQCVVLNACYSEEQAAAIGTYIGTVIGMKDEISDTASIAFSAAFYEALAHGKDLHTAFRLGVSRLKLHDLQDADLPQLMTKRAPGESSA
jgi:hypothetical protein